MISGLYSAATALDAAETRHRIASENLAHVHQPGYRRRLVEQQTFSDVLNQFGNISGYSKTLGTSTNDSEILVDHSAGVLEQSQRPLDVAIQGDGFFAVEGPDGPLYTRNGRFHVNPDGTLVTIDGLAVRGSGGSISLPPGASANAVEIDTTGRLLVDGVEFGRLQLARFADPQQLVAAGASLFRAPDTVTAEEAGAQVLQGFVEKSNVSPMDELINIMISSRQYEAARKAMTSLDESIQNRIDLN